MTTRSGVGGHVLVVAGDHLGDLDGAALPAHDYVIAADSGVRAATRIGLAVDVAVGDFDSLTVDELTTATTNGITIARHPETKDFTDLEIALEYALTLGALRVTVVGGAGGRLDHLMGNLLVLAHDRLKPMRITALVGRARVTVVRSKEVLHGEPGDLVSLFAVNGTVEGVETEGLLYPLVDEPLVAGSTRGVSNEMTLRAASVSVTGGALLAVQPGEKGSHLASGLRR